ncbi:MAG TPA: VTT domain-containing protein [Gemmatimonadaceae bacterium]|nr:VTT domain-containing protein [Gemmatimonadaceae bacterium]
MSGSLAELLARYGYIFIALFMFIESIGVPIPGESALITAAAVAGSGALSIVGVFFAALIGNVLGGMTGYWMGVRGGHAIVARFGRVLRINDERMQKAHVFFEKHGASALIVGRYIAVVRSFLGIFAGVSEMPRRKFLLYNLIGGIIWSLTFCIVGYFFGRNLPALKRELGRVGLVMGIVVGLVILLVVGWRWFSANGPRVLAAMQERWRRFDALPWVVDLRERHPAAWRLLIFKFARGEYLLLHLLVGFILSVAALVVFGVLTEDVIEGAPLTPVDVALADGLRATASPALLSLFRVVAGIGGPITIASIAAVVALILMVRRSWLTLAGWLGAYAGAVALDVVLRRIVIRGELPLSPDLLDSDLLAALPTGHTVGAIVTFGLIAHLLIRRAGHGALRVSVFALALGLLATISLSRLFLGLSYLSTESASAMAGVLWLAASISGLELAKFRRELPEGVGD